MEIQEIKSKLTISEVIKYYGLKADKQNRLKCPFHDDKTPSMQLYYKTQTAFCFSSNCKINGKAVDVIDFILHKENCTKHEAIKKAIEIIGGENKTTAPVKSHNVERAMFLERMFTSICIFISVGLIFSQSSTKQGSVTLNITPYINYFFNGDTLNLNIAVKMNNSGDSNENYIVYYFNPIEYDSDNLIVFDIGKYKLPVSTKEKMSIGGLKHDLARGNLKSKRIEPNNSLIVEYKYKILFSKNQSMAKFHFQSFFFEEKDIPLAVAIKKITLGREAEPAESYIANCDIEINRKKKAVIMSPMSIHHK